MEIRDIQGGPPTTAIAAFETAGYAIADLPPGAGSLLWTISGVTPGASIQGPANEAQVVLVGMHTSALVGDIALTLTFTPSSGGGPSSTSLPLTVFAASIRDAGGAPTPVMDVGVGNRASYVAALDPPLVPDAVAWQPGPDDDIAILAIDGVRALIEGRSPSARGRGSSLTAVLRVGRQQAKATLGIGVFDVRLAFDRASGWLGVGETLLCRAELLPPDLMPLPGGTWAWDSTAQLQSMGTFTGPVASFVANGPSSAVDGDAVELTVTYSGSTVRARRAVTAVGVSILGSDQGEPPLELGLGASAVYLAEVQPPLDAVEAIWASGRAATVEQGGLAARVTGVQPSAFGGADGLEVSVVAGEALTRALIPLTVFGISIEGVTVSPAPATIYHGTTTPYAVATSPALANPAISWSVTGQAAALQGPSTQVQAQVVGIQKSVLPGDVTLSVSVAPAGAPGSAGTAWMQITVQ